MKKVIINGTETLKKLNQGCTKLMRVLAPTYGISGRTVLCAGQLGLPEFLGKGASAAAAINFNDVTENAGATLLRSIGEKTAELTGDGSITAMLIAEAIIRNGTLAITSGCNPVSLRHGIELAGVIAENTLRELTIPACNKYIEAVAALTMRDEELGKLVCQALEMAGYDGDVTIKASDTGKSYVKEDTAYSIPAGYQSKFMADDQFSGETVLRDAAVFVSTAPINSIHDILPLLNEASIQKQPLLIIAESIAPDIVKSFVSNIAQGVIRLCSVEAPGVGVGKRASLEDVAAVTGATVFGTPLTPDTRAALLHSCGKAPIVRITRSKTQIYGTDPNTPRLREYVEHLSSLLKSDHNELEGERIRQRIARLTGHVSELRIGGTSKVEQRLLISRAESSLKAAHSAALSGVLPGGGTAFIRSIPNVMDSCSSLSDEEKIGVHILISALEAPLRTLAINADQSASEIVTHVAKGRGNYGFDAAGHYTDMIHRGIIDSAAVLITALRTAVSAGAQLLTANAAVLIDGVAISSMSIPDDLNLKPQDFR